MNEQDVWEEILQQHGLGVDRGHNPIWLRYGANYFDHERAISYDTADKRPDRRTAVNFSKAKQLLEIMQTGLSMKKAAAALGIPQSSAVRIVKKYRELSTLSTFQTSTEGTL